MAAWDERAPSTPPGREDQGGAPVPGDAERLTHPLFEDGFEFGVYRLSNGEWVMGQFAWAEVPLPGGYGDTLKLFYNRVVRFQLGRNPKGDQTLQMSSWPASRGSIDPAQISAQGFVNVEGDIDLMDKYIEAISPIQRVTPGQAKEVARRKRQAETNAGIILDHFGK